MRAALFPAMACLCLLASLAPAGEAKGIYTFDAEALTSWVAGTVVDQAGDPVAGAEVYVSETDQDWVHPDTGSPGVATTDGHGRYRVAAPPGGAWLWVAGDGLVKARRLAETGGLDNFLLQVLRIPPATAHVRIAVVDHETGSPLAGARLVLESPTYGTTACGGEEGLVCSIRYVEGVFDGWFVPGYTRVQISGPLGCEPGHCSFEKYNQHVETTLLQAGENPAMEARLIPFVNARITVHVRTQEGLPVEGAQVESRSLATAFTGVTDGAGTASVDTQAGQNRIWVGLEGYLSWHGMVDVERGDQSIDVTVTRGQALTGPCCLDATPSSVEVASAATDGAARQAEGPGALAAGALAMAALLACGRRRYS